MRTSSPSSICTPSAFGKPVQAQEMIAVKRPGPRRPVKSATPTPAPAKRSRPGLSAERHNTEPALDVLADVRLGAQAHSLLVGTATLAVDGLGRQVVSIQLAVLPGDGRCYLSLQEVLTLAREQEEDVAHA